MENGSSWTKLNSLKWIKFKWLLLSTTIPLVHNCMEMIVKSVQTLLLQGILGLVFCCCKELWDWYYLLSFCKEWSSLSSVERDKKESIESPSFIEFIHGCHIEKSSSFQKDFWLQIILISPKSCWLTHKTLRKLSNFYWYCDVRRCYSIESHDVISLAYVTSVLHLTHFFKP